MTRCGVLISCEKSREITDLGGQGTCPDNNNKTRSGGIGGVSGKFSIFGAFTKTHRPSRKCGNVKVLMKSLTLNQQDRKTTKLEVMKQVDLV